MHDRILPQLIEVHNGNSGVLYAIVPLFRNEYVTGDDGSAWSRLKMGGGDFLVGNLRSLAGYLTHGYPHVSVLMPDGRHRPYPVHRMVLFAWKRPDTPGEVCRHLNGIKTDNRPVNLEWGTESENVRDRDLHGDVTYKGNGHPQAILTEELVIEARRRAALGEKITDIARDMQLDDNREGLFCAVRGKTWAHLPGAIKKNTTITREEMAILDKINPSLSTAEIARMTGMPYLRVYNHLRRDRRKR